MGVGCRIHGVQAYRAPHQRLKYRREFQSRDVRGQTGVRTAEQCADPAFRVGEARDGDDPQSAVHGAQPHGGVVDIGQGRFQHHQGAGPAGIPVVDIDQIVAAADVESQVGKRLHQSGMPGVVTAKKDDIQRVVH
ncbi:hypothetical protein D3C72_1783140 [compost metagenome]